MMLEHNDLVVGSRYIHGGSISGWGWERRWLSKIGNLAARFSTGTPIGDFTAGFLGWNNHLLEKVISENTENNGYAFLVEMKYRAFSLGAKIEEMPIVFEERVFGQSKMNKKIIVEFFIFCMKILMRRLFFNTRTH